MMVIALALMLAYPHASSTKDPDPLFGPPPRVTIAASATPSSTGWNVRATITPLPGIHVYAPGSDGYIGVSFAVSLPAGWKSTTPTFPTAEPYVFGELKEVVNVYQKPFVITQTVTPPAQRASKPPPKLEGTLKYQACTDRVCYPPQEQMVSIVLRAAPAPASKQE